MTGPEHYQKAERLLEKLAELAEDVIAGRKPAGALATIAPAASMAAAHAQLAVAAAQIEAADTVAQAIYKGSDGYLPAAVDQRWSGVVW